MRPLVPILLVLSFAGCADSAKEQQHKEFIILVEQFIQEARLLSNTGLMSSGAFQIKSPRLDSLCDTVENKVRILQSETESDLDRRRIAAEMKVVSTVLFTYAMSKENVRLAPSESELKALIDQAIEVQKDAKTSIDELEKLLEEYKLKH